MLWKRREEQRERAQEEAHGAEGARPSPAPGGLTTARSHQEAASPVPSVHRRSSSPEEL